MHKIHRIVLVEDDPLQAEWIVDEVVMKTLRDAELRYFDSEHSFFAAVNSGEMQRWNPQFAIIDLLIRYYSVDELEEMNESPDFENLDDPREAGIRCRDALRKVCPAVKVGILTVLDDTPDGLVMKKGEDQSEKLIAFLTQQGA